MPSIHILRERVAALMRQRGWTSNKPLIDASEGRLTNGTLGRIRSQSENCQLSQVDALADVFGVQPWELLRPEGELQAAPTRTVSLGEAVKQLARSLAGLPESRRKNIANLAASQLAESPSPEELTALDALAPGVTVALPLISDEDATELQALREWHSALLAMAELESQQSRAVIDRFLLKVQSALVERERARDTAAAKPTTPPTKSPAKVR